MDKTKQTLALRCLVALLIVISLIWIFGERSDKSTKPRDFDLIKAEGVLRAATEYNSVSYFVENDTIAGFHYSLINAFARAMGVKAEITPVMSFEERMRGLAEGKYDIIAYSTAATAPMKDSLLLSDPIVLNKLVLVQRKAASDSDSLFVSSQIDLGGRTIYMVKGSPDMLRIRNLESEIGDTIYIEEVEKYGSEQLVEMVSHGDIDYTVCDATIAKREAMTLDNIDARTDIGFTQFYSWATSKQSPALMDSLNSFLKSYVKTGEFKRLRQKYYKD
jgi:membrane-bound lytic murein transglycosylase MltF